jgi:hypothetical protein
MISPKFCVTESTFYDWKQQWEANHFWRAWHTEVHGVRLRAFDDDEEAQIGDVIKTEYIGEGRVFTGDPFKNSCREFPNGRVTNTLALRLLNEIWAGLSPASIHAGWAIHEGDFGPEDGDAPDDVEYGEWEE